MVQVTTVAQTIQAAERSVDVIIAQGGEAGGYCGEPEIGPVAGFYFTMSCSLMTDRLSVDGDPLRRKHSHAPVRTVRKCLYVEIGGKVVGRTHHRRWG